MIASSALHTELQVPNVQIKVDLCNIIFIHVARMHGMISALRCCDFATMLHCTW